jgi:ferredoxin
MREIAKQLLDDARVEVIIGYQRGSLPLRTTPCFITESDNVEELVWDITCENNLGKYLEDREEKVGIIAKSCDARSIIACMVEKQIDRNNICIIGIPCSGILDRKKIETRLEGKEILQATIDGEQLILKGTGFTMHLPIKDFLDDSCYSCQHRNPAIYDVLVGEQVPEMMNDKSTTDDNEVPLSSEMRWKYFTTELDKCIRCYACRNVCPLCYCEECFVDQNMPRWLGKTDDISDTMIYHIVRIYHTAGRCVNCGACSRACPVGIDLRKLTQKMAALVKELYGFEAGLSLEDLPPLATFNEDDPQEFIR